MADIFISYARIDQDKVKSIANALEAKGWSVWWDPKIRSGAAFDRLIEKELAKARCVVAVWSRHSVDSDWVRAEASDGLERKILISIAIERDIRPPLRFRNIQTDSLIGWDGKSPSLAFTKIVADLEEIIGPPAKKRITASTKPVIQKAMRPGRKYVPGDMVLIPGGNFLFGDEKNEKSIEYDFFMDVFPVTNTQYKEFIDDSAHDVPYIDKIETKPYNWNRVERSYPEGMSEHPVVLVSHEDVLAFCKWRSERDGKEYRLPTEEEWEKAARGEDGRRYPWGDKFEFKRLNCADYYLQMVIKKADDWKIGFLEDFYEKNKERVLTSPVGQFENGASPYDCQDMAGNVWEWTSSWYDEFKKFRTLRGGSWYAVGYYCRCASRYEFDPDIKDMNVGFRCVRSK